MPFALVADTAESSWNDAACVTNLNFWSAFLYAVTLMTNCFFSHFVFWTSLPWIVQKCIDGNLNDTILICGDYAFCKLIQELPVYEGNEPQRLWTFRWWRVFRSLPFRRLVRRFQDHLIFGRSHFSTTGNCRHKSMAASLVHKRLLRVHVVWKQCQGVGW